MVKIVITGADGQLGNELKKASKNYPFFNFCFTDINKLDITDNSQVINFIKQNNYSYLINCAAYTNVDKAETDESSAFRLNTEAVRYLANAVRMFDMKMIHISTDYVFGGTNYIPYREIDTANPTSVYGQTKYEGEKEINNSDAEAIIIRTSWLYSTFGNNFVKTMLKLGRNNDKVDVVFDQIGSPTYAGDLAETILNIIEKTEKGNMPFVKGIYNYSNEGVASWYDLASEIFRIKNINCKVNPVETKMFPRPAPRPSYSVFNKSKIKTTYDIEIPNWRDSLQKCLNILD